MIELPRAVPLECLPQGKQRLKEVERVGVARRHRALRVVDAISVQGLVEQCDAVGLREGATGEEEIGRAVDRLEAKTVVSHEGGPEELVVDPVLEGVEDALWMVVWVKRLRAVRQPVAHEGVTDGKHLAGHVVECEGAEDYEVRIFRLAPGDGALEQLGLHQVVGVEEVEPLARSLGEARLTSGPLPRHVLPKDAHASIALGCLGEDIGRGIGRPVVDADHLSVALGLREGAF